MMKQAGVVLITRKVSPLRFGEPSREILVTTNRHYGGYSLPGGKVEETDRDPRFTARRELREETSLVAMDSDLTFLYMAMNTVRKEDREVHVFFARSVFGRPRNVEAGTACAWFSFSKLLDNSAFSAYYKKHLPDGIEHLVPTEFAFTP